ncbi:toprim domain-containing protein [Escherichia coli]
MSKGRKLKEAGQFVGHCACPRCGSSDAGSIYHHDDGSYSMTCFSCNKGFPEWDFDKGQIVSTYSTGSDNKNRTFRGMDLDDVKENLEAMDLKDRKIPAKVLERLGIKVDIDSDGEIDAHFYPTYKRNEDGKLEHVGYRVRHRYPEDHPKEHLRGKLKDFSGGVGDIKGELAMFGSWIAPEGGNRLFIWEGEMECATAIYMTSLAIKDKSRRKNYCHVSVPSGANIKSIKDNYQYITSFDEIYLCFDNDEAGAKATKEAAGILPIEKVRLFQYPEGVKDLNEWWTKFYKEKDTVLEGFKQRIYNAPRYCPAGIKNFADGFEAMKNRGQIPLIPFPESFGDLNRLTYGGYGLGEITTIAAPSSVGKSAYTREMIYSAWKETDYNIGVIPVEDTYEELMEMLCAIHLSKQISEIPYDERDWDELKEAHAELSKGRRIHIVDHQGAIDQDNLLEFVDYLVNSLDCKIIILDPITLALSRSDTDEEEVLSELLRRCKRYQYAQVNVCHVRKSAGGQKANSEGGDISEEDIKGSGAYFQISMNNILLMRNKVDPDPVKKNLTKIKLTKCRRHGKSTGIAGHTWYNPDTGRLIKASGCGVDIDGAAENIRQQFGIGEAEDHYDDSLPHYEDEVFDRETGEVYTEEQRQSSTIPPVLSEDADDCPFETE